MCVGTVRDTAYLGVLSGLVLGALAGMIFGQIPPLVLLGLALGAAFDAWIARRNAE